jgi:hypothetical protein
LWFDPAVTQQQAAGGRMVVKLCDGVSRASRFKREGGAKGYQCARFDILRQEMGYFDKLGRIGLDLNRRFSKQLSLEQGLACGLLFGKKIIRDRGQHAKRSRSYFDHSAGHRDCLVHRRGTRGEISTMAEKTHDGARNYGPCPAGTELR